MRLGDPLNVADYDAIWGEQKRTQQPSMIERLTLWLIVVGIGTALGFLPGCDYQAAQATEEIKQAAVQKKAVLGHPCLYVAQCGHPISDCPISKRVCAPSADLRTE